MAFSWAHETDPQAPLFYNDHGAEGLNAKSDAIYNLVKGASREGCSNTWCWVTDAREHRKPAKPVGGSS